MNDLKITADHDFMSVTLRATGKNFRELTFISDYHFCGFFKKSPETLEKQINKIKDKWNKMYQMIQKVQQ